MLLCWCLSRFLLHAGTAVDFHIRRSSELVKTDPCPQVASGSTAVGLVKHVDQMFGILHELWKEMCKPVVLLSLVTSCTSNDSGIFCLNLEPILIRSCFQHGTPHEAFVVYLFGPELFDQISQAPMSLSSVNTALSMGRSLRNNRVIRRGKYSRRKMCTSVSVGENVDGSACRGNTTTNKTMYTILSLDVSR